MIEKCSCSTQEPAIYIAERFFNYQDYIYYKSIIHGQQQK